MENAKSIKTPVNVNSKRLKATDESELVDKSLYPSAVGSLLYLSSRTRPDVAFAVNNVARFCSEPTTQHWNAVKRIFWYLRGMGCNLCQNEYPQYACTMCPICMHNVSNMHAQ